MAGPLIPETRTACRSPVRLASHRTVPVRGAVGERGDCRGLCRFRGDPLAAVRLGEPGDDMKDRIDLSAGIVEPWLRVVGAPIDDAGRPGCRPHRERSNAAGAKGGDVAQRPRRAEQPPLARVHVGEAHPAIARIGGDAGAIGIVAAGNGARSNVIRLAGDHRLGRLDHIGQRLERLHHRNVIGGVNDRASRVSHEVEEPGGWRLAVQLGEIREHAAAELHAGKCRARGSVDIGRLRDPACPSLPGRTALRSTAGDTAIQSGTSPPALMSDAIEPSSSAGSPSPAMTISKPILAPVASFSAR